jgi:hypothetical protein
MSQLSSHHLGENSTALPHVAQAAQRSWAFFNLRTAKKSAVAMGPQRKGAVAMGTAAPSLGFCPIKHGGLGGEGNDRTQTNAEIISRFQRNHGRSVVSISSLANGAFGVHLRHESDGMRVEIAPPGCLSSVRRSTARAFGSSGSGAHSRAAGRC